MIVNKFEIVIDRDNQFEYKYEVNSASVRQNCIILFSS